MRLDVIGVVVVFELLETVFIVEEPKYVILGIELEALTTELYEIDML